MSDRNHDKEMRKYRIMQLYDAIRVKGRLGKRQYLMDANIEWRTMRKDLEIIGAYLWYEERKDFKYQPNEYSELYTRTLQINKGREHERYKEYVEKNEYRLLKMKNLVEREGCIHLKEWAQREGKSKKTVLRDMEDINTYYSIYLGINDVIKRVKGEKGVYALSSDREKRDYEMVQQEKQDLISNYGVIRDGFMRELIATQEEFEEKREVIIQKIVYGTSQSYQEKIKNMYQSLDEYANFLRELTDVEINTQKALVESMLHSLPLEEDVVYCFLYEMYECVEWEEESEKLHDAGYCDEEESEDFEYEYDEDGYDEEEWEEEELEEEEEDYWEEEELEEEEEDYWEEEELEEEEEDYWEEEELEEEEEDYWEEEELEEEEEDYWEEEELEEEEDYDDGWGYLIGDLEREYYSNSYQGKLEAIWEFSQKHNQLSENAQNDITFDMGAILEMKGSADIVVTESNTLLFSEEMRVEASRIFEHGRGATQEELSARLITYIVREREDRRLFDELLRCGSKEQLDLLFLEIVK